MSIFERREGPNFQREDGKEKKLREETGLERERGERMLRKTRGLL